MSLPRRRGRSLTPQAVGVHVVGAEHVAGSVTAVVVGALALGTPAPRPALPSGRAQADRPHLVKGDHHPVVRRDRGAQGQDPRGLGLVIGVRAGLPGAGALKGQPGVSEQPAHVRRADLNAALSQMSRQPGQRPARQRHPLDIGPGSGDRDELPALRGRDPAGPPGPRPRKQRVKPPLVEVVDDLAHMTIVGQPRTRDRARRQPRVRAQHDRRALTRGLVLRALGQPLQPQRLLVRERPNEHLRRTHQHLHHRDANQFATHTPIPVRTSEKAH